MTRNESAATCAVPGPYKFRCKLQRTSAHHHLSCASKSTGLVVVAELQLNFSSFEFSCGSWAPWCHSSVFGHSWSDVQRKSHLQAHVGGGALLKECSKTERLAHLLLTHCRCFYIRTSSLLRAQVLRIGGCDCTKVDRTFIF